MWFFSPGIWFSWTRTETLHTIKPSISDFASVEIDFARSAWSGKLFYYIFSKQIFFRSVNDIDLYTGGLCETPVADGLVGPVFACIIGKQFHNIRRGDRYWYETDMPDSSFSLGMYCSTGDYKELLPVLFARRTAEWNPYNKSFADNVREWW